MKTISLFIALFIISTTAFATDMQRVGFKAYSTQTPVTCVVSGMRTLLARSFQGFAPVPSYSRTYPIGTKGYANYSTGDKGSVRIQCKNTDTSITVAVKIQYGGFLNGVENHFFTLAFDELVIQ